MKNLLILSSAIIISSWWMLQQILSSYPDIDEKESALNEIKIVREAPLDIEAVSKSLGVEFEKVDKTLVESSPKSRSAKLSLIALYTTGEIAVARVKIQLKEHDELINLRQGDLLYQYQVTNVDVNSVTLSPGSAQPIVLKMFKPLTVSIMTPEANGEV